MHWPSALSGVMPVGCAVPQLLAHVWSFAAQLFRQPRRAVHSELPMHPSYDVQHEPWRHESHAATPVFGLHVPPPLELPLELPLLEPELLPLLHSDVAACAAAVQSLHDAQEYELPFDVFQRALEQTPPVVW
jgi:hypothetical protein